MILLNDIVEIFRAPDSDQPKPAAHHQQAIPIEQTNRIRSALVDNNFVWPTVSADGFHEKCSSCGLVAALRQHRGVKTVSCATRPLPR